METRRALSLCLCLFVCVCVSRRSSSGSIRVRRIFVLPNPKKVDTQAQRISLVSHIVFFLVFFGNICIDKWNGQEGGLIDQVFFWILGGRNTPETYRPPARQGGVQTGG